MATRWNEIEKETTMRLLCLHRKPFSRRLLLFFEAAFAFFRGGFRVFRETFAFHCGLFAFFLGTKPATRGRMSRDPRARVAGYLPEKNGFWAGALRRGR